MMCNCPRFSEIFFDKLKMFALECILNLRKVLDSYFLMYISAHAAL